MASGLQLPGGLVSLLNDLGYTWPDADEVRLCQLGQAWTSVQSALDQHLQVVTGAAERVWTENTGTDIDAFRTYWNTSDGPVETLNRDATGVAIVGAIVAVCSVVVLMLKVWVIAQLVMLAIAIVQAIATAPVTFGASLLEIPVVKEIIGRIINLLISRAMAVLLG